MNGRSLFVGGGPEKFVAYVDTGESFQILCTSDLRIEGECEIVAGGQMGTYPARHCVDLATVHAAVEHFAQTGETNPEATWEKS